MITVYEKPTCTTCRRVHKALVEAGVDFNTVNYYVRPLSRTTLKALLRKMGKTPRQLLRTNEPAYRRLKLATRVLSDSQLIDLMVKYPDLLQRPIVERGKKAILARPPERLKEIL